MKYQQDHLFHVQHLPGHPGACAAVPCWLDFDSLAWCILKGSFWHPQLAASEKKSPMALCCDLLNTWPVQFSRSVVSDSLPPHGPQHTRPPCPSPTPGAYSNSRPLSRWCHPTISSSVVPSSSCLQSFPASGSFPMSQLFTSGGHSWPETSLNSIPFYDCLHNLCLGF